MHFKHNFLLKTEHDQNETTFNDSPIWKTDGYKQTHFECFQHNTKKTHECATCLHSLCSGGWGLSFDVPVRVGVALGFDSGRISLDTRFTTTLGRHRYLL